MSNWDSMYDDPYAVKRVEKACELLKKHLDSGTVVEVGSFQNLSWEYLKGHDYFYYPCDQKQYTDWTNLIDLEDHLFSLIPCDAILLLEVLEHIKNPQEILNRLCGFLRYNGTLIVSLPNEATLFHRIRGLLGIIDGACFGPSPLKHLHLPSFVQARSFLTEFGRIIEFHAYINPSAKGSRQEWLGRWMKLVPDWMWQWLADRLPSLFARGWIFVLKPYRPKNHLQNESAEDYKLAVLSPNF